MNECNGVTLYRNWHSIHSYSFSDRFVQKRNINHIKDSDITTITLVFRLRRAGPRGFARSLLFTVFG